MFLAVKCKRVCNGVREHKKENHQFRRAGLCCIRRQRGVFQRAYLYAEDGALVREENGELCVYVLPIEENRITDPELLAYLNATPIPPPNWGLSPGISAMAIKPDCPIFTEKVANGVYTMITPTIPVDPTYTYAVLQCKSFQLLKSKKLKVQVITRDFLGGWYSNSWNVWDFGLHSKLYVDQGSGSVISVAFTMTSEVKAGYTYTILNQDIQ